MKISIKILMLSLLFISVSCLKEDDGMIIIEPIQGDTLQPDVGGPNQPNQIWVDLSTGEMKETVRTSWDLGFYSGNQFSVILNTAALMSASPVEGFTELSQVNSQNQSALMQMVQVANFDPNNINFIDDVSGNYLDNGTVIDQENQIYIINLGFEIPNGSFSPGVSYAAGNARGWKKIKISNETDGYNVQYADLDDTEIQEIFVPKDTNFNFSFLSLVTGSIVDIQPTKEDWDLCFTVFVNEVTDNNGNTQGSYIFTDFILTNTMAQTGAYEVITNQSTLIQDYNNFTIENVNQNAFIYDDHRAIGSNWRTIPGAIVRNDRFYVLKDPHGVLFKIRFISMSDAEGYRGYPVFEYEPL